MAENNGFGFLGNLQAEETELPKRSATGGGRARAVQDNPFVAWVSESYSDGKGRSVTVPAEHAVKTEYLIRQAAEDLGLGVRVVRLVDGEQVEKSAIKDLHKKKNVKVQFQGQTKRAYSPRKRKGAEESAPEIAE